MDRASESGDKSNACSEYENEEEAAQKDKMAQLPKKSNPMRTKLLANLNRLQEEEDLLRRMLKRKEALKEKDRRKIRPDLIIIPKHGER